ncbi:Glycosyltransferase [Minicystis rosea]|nr:Glycosyltransferase [Minicystis rosea]
MSVRAGATILMTADTLGGVWSYAIDLARALAVHDFRVILAAMGGPLSPAQRRDAATIEGLVVHESDYRLEWMDDPWDDVARAGDWLLSLEERARPDIVHINGFAHAALPFRAPRIAVVHSCVLSWWSAVRGEEAPRRYDRYRREVQAGLRVAGAVIAPTHAMLSEAARRYGPFRRSFVVPNAASAARHRPADKEGFILAVGRLWDDAKNISALCEVAERLPWPVVVAGSDEHPDLGKRSFRGVRMLGILDRDEVAAWMARASIYALPARYEPFGLSVLEAALSGCALTLGDIPSLREIWGGAGALFVDPRSIEQMESALRLLIEAPELRLEMAREARARALEHTPERMARGYLDIYEARVSEASADEETQEEPCA